MAETPSWRAAKKKVAHTNERRFFSSRARLSQSVARAPAGGPLKVGEIKWASHFSRPGRPFLHPTTTGERRPLFVLIGIAVSTSGHPLLDAHGLKKKKNLFLAKDDGEVFPTMTSFVRSPPSLLFSSPHSFSRISPGCVAPDFDVAHLAQWVQELGRRRTATSSPPGSG